MYLSAATPHWHPATEADLQTAVDAGLLVESHYFEMKREIGSTKGANRELARDLAQFAIDGGLLIVGVDEHRNDPSAYPTLYPVALDGLPERVDAIARTIVDAPLAVECTTIPSANDSSAGYLLIRVPVSGTAPHMVDGVYYGRGDTAKRKLSDAEVRALHQSRTVAKSAADDLLEAYVQRDPVTENRRQAHYFVVAAPAFPRTGMLLDAVSGPQWHELFTELVKPGRAIDDTMFAPTLSRAAEYFRRHGGVALTSWLTHDRRTMGYGGSAEDAFELELTEEGAVRMMTTRLSSQLGLDHPQQIITEVLPVLTRQTLAIAAGIAGHTGYQGPWLLACAATGIAGMPTTAGRLGIGYPIPRDLHEYRETTRASSAELTQMPGLITDRLIGRLLRTAGLERSFADYLS